MQIRLTLIVAKRHIAWTTLRGRNGGRRLMANVEVCGISGNNSSQSSSVRSHTY